MVQKPSRVGTDLEHKNRKERKFSETEDTLPQFKTSVKPPDHRSSFIEGAFAHLGIFNPLQKPISANDTLWLLDNTAFRGANGQWQAEFVAAAFDQNAGTEVSKVVADIAEKVGLGDGDKDEKTMGERLLPFLQTILPGRIARITFSGKKELKLGPGGSNGITSEVKTLLDGKDGDIVESIAKVPTGTNGVLAMQTVYAEPEGWGVISDIDDSIKVTQTSDPIGILRSTFVSTPIPIEGMPELYQFIQKLITPASPWFYLSASPYNLYSFLSDFRKKYYPQGTMILRDASWMTLPGLLSDLTLGTQAYKVDRMVKVHGWLPKRKMICVGDSTQSDPEAYAEIYKKFPGWVKVILIRKVTDIAAIGIAEKDKPERFEKAFEGVPKDVWHLFEDPAECQQIIQDAVARG